MGCQTVVRVCVCACVRACVCTCVCACVCACVYEGMCVWGEGGRGMGEGVGVDMGGSE